jgi:hypothetical protein
LTNNAILNQRIWHNFYLKIDNKPFHFREFSGANVNYIHQLVNADGSIKNWIQLKTQFNIENKHYFKYNQMIHSLPPDWRHLILEGVLQNADEPNPTQGILQCSKILPMEKLISKQIYAILLRKRHHLPT